MIRQHLYRNGNASGQHQPNGRKHQNQNYAENRTDAQYNSTITGNLLLFCQADVIPSPVFDLFLCHHVIGPVHSNISVLFNLVLKCLPDLFLIPAADDPVVFIQQKKTFCVHGSVFRYDIRKHGGIDVHRNIAKRLAYGHHLIQRIFLSTLGGKYLSDNRYGEYL